MFTLSISFLSICHYSKLFLFFLHFYPRVYTFTRCRQMFYHQSREDEHFMDTVKIFSFDDTKGILQYDCVSYNFDRTQGKSLERFYDKNTKNFFIAILSWTCLIFIPNVVVVSSCSHQLLCSLLSLIFAYFSFFCFLLMPVSYYT